MRVKERLLIPPTPPKLDVGDALSTGWRLFQEHAGAYIAWSLIVLVLPYALAAIVASFWENGFLVVFLLVRIPTAFLVVGPFIAASNCLRHGGPGFRFADLVRTGLFYFAPVFLIHLITIFFVCVGFLFFLVPGWYLALTLSFSVSVYIEYHKDVGIFDSLYISFKASNSVLCDMLLLYLATCGILLLGLLCFGFGVIVAFPVVMLAHAAAFHQVFGMNEQYDGCPTHVVCCC